MSQDPAAIAAEKTARAAAATRPALRALTGNQRRALLHDIARAIRAAQPHILHANQRDLEHANTIPDAMRDRLRLDPPRIDAMADAVHAIAEQPDPVGRVVDGRVLPNGIRLERRRVPLGTILIIYESRPNVTSDAAALCLKSANAVVLKGGSEALHTNRAIVHAIRATLHNHQLADAVGFVDSTDRAATTHLLTLRGVIDLAIPRGGPALINAVAAAATIPVVKHDAGNCHIYIDNALDEPAIPNAIDIVANAKAQRPAVCNAVETLLVHHHIAPRILPALGQRMDSLGVQLRADERAAKLLPRSTPATELDWETEFLDLILAVRVVDSLEHACQHIRRYGSGHTEAIITHDLRAAQRFIDETDSASVMVNCSTRFADGGQYGLGAEIGISTDKLHARGPMGAEDLTTYQWIAHGSGQTRP